MDQLLKSNAEPIPGYRLIQRIGRGGFGEVWKAEAPGGIHKAIKFVAGDANDLGDDGKAAEQEYKSLGRVKTIRHPFLLSLERFEVIDGQLVIVMELADRNLWDRFTECVRNGLAGVPRPELLRYMEEAAEALDLMNIHHQIQHLDVKPQNIFLVHQHVKVADFGLAKDLEGTRTKVTGGVTPTYAPPETFEGWVSRQSDQYSLAIVYMEMLTGRRPFNGANTRQLIFQHLTVAPDLSPLPEADRQAVERALAKSPEARFPTCADFVRALRGEERPEPVGTPAPANAPADPPETDAGPGPMQPTPLTVRRSVPALVTPTSKLSVLKSRLREQTPDAAPAASAAGPAPERTGDGVLVPAVIIGVGRFGLSVLRALRQLVTDRFGRPNLPHLRWLFVDTDSATADAALAGPELVALSPEDVLIAPLRRPAHYLTHDRMPAVGTWLPEDELYRMPRTPATDGRRGLGRLALCDHYHVVRHRIRTALEPFLTPTAIDEAARQTGLGLRSTYPRVYLAASLAGGTGSGMFLDLAYLVRNVGRQLGFRNLPVVGLLGVPAQAGPADAQGFGNARAALTELHHFERPGQGYRATFDTREGPLADPDRPFRRCVLVAQGGRLDPDATARAIDVAAHAAFVELLTTLGPAARPEGDKPAVAAHVLPGIVRLAWPRTAVLRAAGWLLARRTLQGWCARASDEPSPAIDEVVEAIWAEGHFDRAELRWKLEERIAASLKGDLAGMMADRLREVLSGSRCGVPDAALVRNALRALLELLGRPGHDDSEHPHQLGRAMADAVREMAAQGDRRLAGSVFSLLDIPGLRVAGAEEVVRLARQRLTDELARADREAAAADERSNALFVPIYQQFFAPAGSSRASAPTPEVRGDTLHEWALMRAAALMARGVASIFRVLLGNLPEHVRELTAVRNQVAAMVAHLDADPPTLPAADGVTRPIFPTGDGSSAGWAAQLVTSLTPDDLAEFETTLQTHCKLSYGGLAVVCSRSRDYGRGFLRAVVERSIAFLEARTPHMTATQVLAMQCGNPDGLREKAAELVALATPAPLGPERPSAPLLTVLGLPADDGSSTFADLVRTHAHGNVFRTEPTGDEIVIYQETEVFLHTLPHLTTHPPADFSEPGTRGKSAHARTDVAWTPAGQA